MSNQIIVLSVQPIKDAKNQTSGYEVTDIVSGKKFDAEKNGLRHIMMHLAFQKGQYVYRYGKKWRRGSADAKIFTVYNVPGLAKINPPAKKTSKKAVVNVPVPTQEVAPEAVEA